MYTYALIHSGASYALISIWSLTCSSNVQMWSHHHQNGRNRIIPFICNVLDTEDAEYVGGCLPQRTHCYDPAVALPVDDRLDDVRSKSEAEENGEEVCGSRIWAEGRPYRVWICSSWAASHHGLRVQRQLGIVEWISFET